jgi:hypothetical protein
MIHRIQFIEYYIKNIMHRMQCIEYNAYKGCCSKNKINKFCFCNILAPDDLIIIILVCFPHNL